MVSTSQAAEALKRYHEGGLFRPYEMPKELRAKKAKEIEEKLKPIRKAWREFAIEPMTPEKEKEWAKAFDKVKWMAIGATSPLAIKQLPGGAARIGTRMFKTQAEARAVGDWAERTRRHLADYYRGIKLMGTGSRYISKGDKFIERPEWVKGAEFSKKAGGMTKNLALEKEAYTKGYINFTKTERRAVLKDPGLIAKLIPDKVSQLLKDLWKRGGKLGSELIRKQQEKDVARAMAKLAKRVGR